MMAHDASDFAAQIPAAEFSRVTDDIREVVQRQPDSIAIEDTEGDLTYSDFWKLVGALCSRLQEGGVGPGSRVLIAGDKNRGFVVALVAVLHIGAVAVPIDLAFPSHRRRVMADEAAVTAVVLTGPADDRQYADHTAAARVVLAAIDSDRPTPTADRRSTPPQDDGAYVFFTSGSTGTPKGILGSHRSLSHFISWQREAFQIGPSDRVALVAGISFDPVLREVLTPLTVGATVCILPTLHPHETLDWIISERITICSGTPTFVGIWLASAAQPVTGSSLRFLFLSGEILTDSLVASWRARVSPPGTIVNLYGPTETTMIRTWHAIENDPIPGPQPVGIPLPDTQILVVDEEDRLCPPGTPGEVLIRTPYRSHGYINAPEEQRRSFVTNPLGDDPMDIVYRTRDKGVLDEEGVLTIRGRIDDQIRTQGGFAHPGEVAAHLEAHDKVIAAAVVVTRNGEDETDTVAFLATQEPITPTDLRQFLADRLLPEEMPSEYHFVPQLPLTVNGKVDRARLLELRNEPRDGDALATSVARLDPAKRERVIAALRSRVARTEAGSGLEAALEQLTREDREQAINRLRARVGATRGASTSSVHSLADTVTALPGDQQKALLAHLKRRRARSARGESARSNGKPLSFAQERLWFLDRLEPGTGSYNVYRVQRHVGPLDLDAFKAGLDALARRHEVLRTRYVELDGDPVQIVDPPSPIGVTLIDLAGAPELDAAMRRTVESEIARPFDLAAGPVWRNTIIRLSDQEHIAVVVIHHIAADGWSFDIIDREMAEVYGAHIEGRTPLLPDLPIQYVDFASGQRSRLADGQLEQELNFWEQQLAGELPVLDLHPDRPRPAIRSSAGRTVRFEIPRVNPSDLRRLATRLGTTPFIVGLAFYQAFLYRYTGSQDVIVGVPTANRGVLEAEPLIGFFINTVAMRTKLDPDESLETLIRRVHNVSVTGYAHSEVPFERVVDRIGTDRDPSRMPVVETLFQYGQGSLAAPPALPSIETTNMWFDNYTAMFDFDIELIDRDDTLAGTSTFSTDLYNESTIERLVGHFCTFVANALEAPNRSVSEIDMMTVEERRLVTDEFAHGSPPRFRKTAIAMIQENARQRPEQTAVVAESMKVSYRELLERATDLAGYLGATGVTRGDRVALAMDRSVDMVAAILGTALVGAAYVPIDPALPAARIAFMLEDATPAAIIADPAVELPRSNAPVLYADRAGGSAPPFDQVGLPALTDPAYVIYTSGTSGTPKGVVVTHSSLAEYVLNVRDVYGITADDRWLQFHSPSFDASIEEILGSLAAGATLVLRSDDMMGSAQRMLAAIAQKEVTVLTLPTAFWHELASEMITRTLPAPPGLRVMCMGGEAAAPEIVRAWKDQHPDQPILMNGYGPTETTIAATFADLTAEDNPGERNVTIGRPLPSMTAYVVDEQLRPVPIGVPGELLLGGPQVAAGYLDRPELTSLRFIPDPVTGHGRVYRTGDRVRWRPDGQIDFLGRVDRQVKVRGYRIELPEVEAALLGHPDITAAAVVPEKSGNTTTLAAHVVGTPELDETTILQFASEVLPSYMVPAHVDIRHELPRSAGGKADVARIAATSREPGPDRESIPRRGLSEAPLSYGQRRLWFLDRLDPGESTYLIPQTLRLHGELDRVALQQAFDELVRRHASLRTRFENREGTPVQVIDEAVTAPFEYLDLSGDDAASREQHAAEFIARFESEPIDLAEDRMLRSALVRLSLREHILCVVIHHIAADEDSFHVLWDEIAHAYDAYHRGVPPELDDLPAQYADFAIWQRERIESGQLANDVDFWRRELESPLPIVSLDSGNFVAPRLSTRGAWAAVNLDSATWSTLTSIAREEGATPFMALLTTLIASLHRVTGDSDLLVGIPGSERSREETERMIGFFVNTLPIRSSIESETSFRSLLKKVRDKVIDSIEHREVPFEVLVEQLLPDRNLSRAPLVQVMCAYTAEDDDSVRLNGIEAVPYQTDYSDTTGESSKFEITAYGIDTDDGLRISLNYNTDLYDPQTIERFGSNLARIAGSAAATPDDPIAALEMVSMPQREWLLDSLNDTARAFPCDSSIPEVFAEVASQNASLVAVVDESITLTYGELAAAAETLAAKMTAAGIRPGDTVGLRMQRSAQLVVAMLATLMADACYVPLDPAYPDARLALMESDAGLRAVVAIGSGGPNVELVAPNAEPRFPDSRPAYVMYTSGSTGRPKGVVVPHKAILRLVLNTDYVQLDSDDTVAHASNTSFDAATWEVWGSLLNGARLVVINSDTLTSPKTLSDELRKSGVTAMFVTTALFNVIAREEPDAFSSLSHLIVGGEALDVEAVRRVLAAGPPHRLLNGYGPTESTTFASWHEIDDLPPDASSVPIGLPLANTTLHVLGPGMGLLPPGVPGELYIGGEGLADGYLGDEALTAAKFIPDPFRDVEGARLYRTGDLVRRRDDGRIEFLGRVDRQVKLRGFRIEPGELENHLRRHEDVAQAVVRVWSRNGDSRLVAYVVPTRDRTVDPAAVVAYLRDLVPEHMIPAHIAVLDELPLNPNGKVDLASLPEPDPAVAGAYVQPPDEATASMAALWARVLKTDRVGLTDSFFDLGGHSLLAVELMAAVEKSIGKRVPLSALFESPTLGEFTARVARQDDDAVAPQVVPIRRGGTAPPLFCLHPGGGSVFVYKPMSNHISPDHPVLGIQARGIDGRLDPHTTIEEMAAEYVRIVKSVQPDGPYHLAGYSLGGVIAYETARRLRAAGERVGLVALLDTYFPGRETWQDRTRREFRRLKRLGWSGLRDVIWDIWLSAREVLGRWRYAPRWTFYRRSGRPIPPLLAGKRLTHVALAAYRSYTPQPYDGEILFFRATAHYDPSESDVVAPWRDMARIRVVDVAGRHTGHDAIVDPPNVAIIGDEIDRWLREEAEQ
jgi:amino acid adenylation domain-containing protein